MATGTVPLAGAPVTTGTLVTPVKPNSSRSSTPPVPHGTTPLSHQVAGHVFGRENGRTKNKMGFLQCDDDGAVLKPIQGPGKGQRELEFYQQLFDADCRDPVLVKLRQFVPNYIGTWTTEEHPGAFYLKLSDVTRPFVNPSIMDVKIGPITYDSEADAAKRERELAKFPALKQVKFQLVGMKVYNPFTESYTTIDRTFLRGLNEETIRTEGLAAYFRSADTLQCRLIAAFLRRLTAIEVWFVDQHQLQFIASSLLFVYDGLKLGQLLEKERVLNSTSPSIIPVFNWTVDDPVFDACVDLRMIDFTHVFPLLLADNALDDNYLLGLRSLMSYLRRMLRDIAEL